MEVAHWKNEKKTIVDYLDLNEITQMETELSHDVFNSLKLADRVQETPKAKNLLKDVQREYGNLRSDAL
eukprot:CAMPEP_0168327364 /NCGR_PEP_ID=MMETSP0213-20121227/5856_1 /TAXON_ID=151035 /ORGANISM="Euplotes harpa, Strain FSP1.4" /LENGTH=68 /DNA_ID=CAMNT_0008330259 /DNA_START=196 /DNA_END=402 /DNA_ORIENTATION=-